MLSEGKPGVQCALSNRRAHPSQEGCDPKNRLFVQTWRLSADEQLSDTPFGNNGEQDAREG
jgi:hypothetical protein